VLGSAELFKTNTVAQERADVAETANLTAAQVGQQVLERKGTMSSYAIRADLATTDDETARLRRFLNVTEFNQAQLVAANGTVVGFWGDEVTASQRERVVGSDVGGADYFRRAMAGERYVELLGPSQVRRTDRRLVLFSVPVGLSTTGEAQGEFVAGLFVEVDRRAGQSQINQSTDLFEAVAPQERATQSVRVAGRNVSDGRVVLHRPDRRFARNVSATATVRTGAGRNWQVTVIRDRSTLQDRIARLQTVQFGGLVLVALVVLGLGYWEYSMTWRQTDELLDGFAALEAGAFDRRLSLRAAEEWEQISDGFNDLAAGLRERERAIREREQRLGVLNRVLRHNLQNDMNVILTYAELLPEMDGDEQAEAAETIVEKGTGLVAHGVKARKIEEAMEAAEAGLVDHDLAEVVADVLADLREDYPEASIENDLPGSVPVAGIESLAFAVESLCENALEHNDAATPWLGVSVDREGDEVRLNVADDGPGIPEYERRNVTEGEETDLEHGSGLGLFLATWVAEKSDGEITFDVDEDGSVVTLVLPPAEAAETR
jgi:signal transduction histidine kinase